MQAERKQIENKSELEIARDLLLADNKYQAIGRLSAQIAKQIIALRYVHESANVLSDTYFDKYAAEFLSTMENAENLLLNLQGIKQRFDSLEKDVIWTLAERSEQHIRKPEKQEAEVKSHK